MPSFGFRGAPRSRRRLRRQPAHRRAHSRAAICRRGRRWHARHLHPAQAFFPRLGAPRREAAAHRPKCAFAHPPSRAAVEAPPAPPACTAPSAPKRCRSPCGPQLRCTETPARTLADPSQHGGVGSRRRPSDRAGAAVIAAARPSASTRSCGAADGGRGIRGSFTS
eukprot:scaffold9221_cov118-Isochrysis_galbana.AAC.6